MTDHQMNYVQIRSRPYSAHASRGRGVYQKRADLLSIQGHATFQNCKVQEKTSGFESAIDDNDLDQPPMVLLRIDF